MENPEAGGKCAIIVHGYADAKVGGIAWAPLLFSLGYSVLAVDLRAHGDSDGCCTSAGFWERHDIGQIINQLKSTSPAQTRQVALFGISLGAAVVAAAAALRSDLAAVILECPFADFRSAAASHANRAGAPGPMFQKMAFALSERIAQCDFSEVAPVATLPRISCPIMVIQSADDPLVELPDRQRIQQAMQLRRQSDKPSAYWELQGVHHVMGLRDESEAYRRRVEEFLTGALQYTARLCES
jgi:pimeloyl-ACP methyl ester carboxylesterase